MAFKMKMVTLTMLSTNLLEVMLFNWSKIVEEYQFAQLMKMVMKQ